MIDCYMYVGMYQGAHGSPARGLRGRFHFHHRAGAGAALPALVPTTLESELPFICKSRSKYRHYVPL